MSDEPGILYVVASPIGNLGDLSVRARELLTTVPVVVAEDSRVSRKLLNHVGGKPKIVSFHAHSDKARLGRVLEILESGRDVALLTDAGTPGVSDPGARLVEAARRVGVRVVPVPGPSAVATALSASGLSADRYTFLGFLPRKGKERARLIRQISESEWTTVFFEAANRLTGSLDDLIEACGADRPAVVARELSKVFEEIRAGTLDELVVYYRNEPPRGEVTVVLAGVEIGAPAVDTEEVILRARDLIEHGATRKDAVERITAEMGLPRNEVYKLVQKA